MGAICSIPCKILMKMYDCIEVIVCCKCVTCAISTMKYLLTVLNFLFIILGAVIAGIGAFLLRDQYFRETYGSSVETAGIAFMCLGIFTILLAIIGCIGAKNYNKTALIWYMGFTFIIMICQLVFSLEAAELAADGGVFSICVKRGTPATSSVTGPEGVDIDVNCADFAENGLRAGSYGLWQNVWNDAEAYRCCRGSYWEPGTTALKASFPTETQFHTSLTPATRNCKYWNQETAAKICGDASDGGEAALDLLAGLQEKGKCCGFGKPYKYGDPVYAAGNLTASADGTHTTSPGDGLGCIRNTQSNSLLPKSTKEQVQQCFGYDMVTGEKLKTTPFDGSAGACPSDGTGIGGTPNAFEGYYCNWAPGPSGPESSCGESGSEKYPYTSKGNFGCTTNNRYFRYPQLAYQEYDFPVGECPTLCYPYGCAQVVYEFVRNRLAAFSLIVALLIVVNTFGFFTACCLTVSHHVTDGKGDKDNKERAPLRKPGNTSERV